MYEGDASLTMAQWAAGNLGPAELLQILGASADPQAGAALNRAPAILRAPLEFPYTTGLNFVSAAYGQGQWPAVDAFYGRMPTSTEQILHPEKYAAAEAPVKVTMPADLAKRLGPGWSVPLQDTFGELQLGIWLQEGGVDQTAATAAAAGWGGDRLAVLEGPGGAWSIAMQTTWDTEADAAAFETAATTALGKAQGVSRVLPGGRRQDTLGARRRWRDVAPEGRRRARPGRLGAGRSRRFPPALKPPTRDPRGNATPRARLFRWFQPSETIRATQDGFAWPKRPDDPLPGRRPHRGCARWATGLCALGQGW